MSTTGSDYSLTPKNQSLSDSQNFNKYFSHLSLNNKIPPIPLVRKDLANSSYTRNRLQIYGYKNFSKVSAVGKGTQKVLSHIKHSQNLKTVQALEFDPYLCDSSYLKDFVRALNKLKDLKGVNIIVRRVDRTNESNILLPFIKRLAKLKALRIEVPSTENLNEDGLINFLRIVKKCYKLRRLETKFVNTAETSNNFEFQFMECNQYHKYLEELNMFHSVKKGTLKEEYNYSAPFLNYRLPLLKKLSIVCSVSSEWESKTGENSNLAESYCSEWMARFPNIEEMTMKFINAMDTNEIVSGFSILTTIPHLKTLNYEALSCRIGDMELMAILFGITKMKQIKNLNFKLIQRSTVSEMVIAKFVEIVSKQENIENFNIYFRRLDLPDQILAEFVNDICRMNKVKCERYRGSLHFYRYKVPEASEINSIEEDF